MNFSLFRTPKEKMASVLTLLAILAIFKHFSIELMARFILLFFFMFSFEFIFWKLRRVEPFRPTAGAVTTLIIFLLAGPKAPLALVILALFLAIGIKQFIRPQGGHIFNPAASGLFLASFFGLSVTWWGVSWGAIPLAITILGAGFVSLYTIRQSGIIAPYLVVSFLLSLFLVGNPAAATGQLLVGSFWFFALVMLPEPQTAAHYPNTRVVYGALVALLSFAFAFSGVRMDPLLAALLIGNLGARLIEQKYKV